MLRMMMRGSAVALALSLVFNGPSATAQSQSVVYTYDPLGRIVTATYSNGASVVYSYDAAGNRTQVSSTQATPPPVAGNVSASIPYNTSQNIPLSITGVYNNVAVVTGPIHGSVTMGASSATYTPNSGYVGSDSFSYLASGVGGTSAPGTVNLTIHAPAAPSANDANLSVGYNSSGSLALPVAGLINGVILVASPGKGVATVSGTTVVYTPGTSQYGADSFTYRADGPGGSSPVRTVSVQIANPPPPTASDRTVSVNNAVPTSIQIPGGGDWVQLNIVSGPSHGSISVAPMSGGSWTVTYTPQGVYSGLDSFIYNISNPGGNSGNRTVTLNVAPPAAPTAAAASLTLLSLTSGQLNLPIGGVASGAEVVSGPAHGSVSLSGVTANYTPAGAYVGGDSFTYRAVGPGGVSSPATVSVTVQNRAPTAVNDTITTMQNQSITFDPRANDSDPEGQALSVALAWGAQNGALNSTATSITYTPSAGYYGSDSFTYTIVDGFGGSATATVSVTVQPAPVFSAGTSQTSWLAQRYGNTPIVNDPPISVSVANGSGPYTYAWEKVSGDTSTTVNPSGATATWSRSLAQPGMFASTWRCKVTDSQGRVAYTPLINVTFYRENP